MSKYSREKADRGFRIDVDAKSAKARQGIIGRMISEQLGKATESSKKAFASEMVRVFAETVRNCPIGDPNPGTRKNQQAPGRLRASGTLTLDGALVATGAEGGYAITSGGNTSATKAEIAYNTPYAFTQHEQLNYAHRYGGRAKYIEAVLLEEQERMRQTIAGRYD